MPRTDDLRRQLVAGGIVTLLALAVVFGGRMYRAAVDLWNGFAMEPMERVHGDLLPSWALSLSGVPGMQPEDEAFAELMQALDEGRADALPPLAERLRAAFRSQASAEEVAALLQAWNDALDDEGIPFVIRGGILERDGQRQYFVTTARTLHDVEVSVGDAASRVRVVERVDQTNIREAVLGETADVAEGGLVLSDRVLEFTLDRIWPVLDADAEMPAWAATFADDVRAEVRRDLDPTDYARLEATASKRLAAVKAVLTIQSRRACSGFILRDIGWAGPSEDDMETLKRFIQQTKDCPAVYEVEYEAIRDFRRLAGGTDGLEAAVGSLLAWSMRPIALHEARHAADAAITGALSQPVPCKGCEGLSDRERIELSAYTAEFAWTDTPATAAYQVCLVLGSRAGSHRGAMEFLFERLDGDCIFGLPDPAEVRAFAKRAFDRDDPMTLPEAFPTRVALPPRARATSGT